MKLLFVANANNYHTLKWTSWFTARGYEVHVASLEAPTEATCSTHSGATFHWLGSHVDRKGSQLAKVAYLLRVNRLRKLIQTLRPDLVHAHYASSYGFLTALACAKPDYVSVWGTDIAEFPKKSWLHRTLIRFTLSRFTRVLATSKALAADTAEYTSRPIAVTPFGVDTEVFRHVHSRKANEDKFTVGTVKGLDRRYRIDLIISAAKILLDRRPDIPLHILIAGAGNEAERLLSLTKQLGVDSITTWLGHVPTDEVPSIWHKIDVAIIPSDFESFGVSALEARASGVPLVISDVPGLVEACNGGQAAMVVPRSDAKAIADAVEQLYDDPNLRYEIGVNARKLVEDSYQLAECFELVECEYNRLLRAR